MSEFGPVLKLFGLLSCGSVAVNLNMFVSRIGKIKHDIASREETLHSEYKAAEKCGIPREAIDTELEYRQIEKSDPERAAIIKEEIIKEFPKTVSDIMQRNREKSMYKIMRERGEINKPHG